MGKIILCCVPGNAHTLRAKVFLKKHISSDSDILEIDVNSKPELQEIISQLTSGDVSLPQIFFNEQHIGGAQKVYELQQDKQLGPMIKELLQQPPPSKEFLSKFMAVDYTHTEETSYNESTDDELDVDSPLPEILSVCSPVLSVNSPMTYLGAQRFGYDDINSENASSGDESVSSVKSESLPRRKNRSQSVMISSPSDVPRKLSMESGVQPNKLQLQALQNMTIMVSSTHDETPRLDQRSPFSRAGDKNSFRGSDSPTISARVSLSRNVSDPHIFAQGPNFSEISSPTVTPGNLSIKDFDTNSEDQLEEFWFMVSNNKTGLQIKDRTLRLKPVKRCFRASEFVDWIILHFPSNSRGDAVEFARKLLEVKFIHGINHMKFEDSKDYLFRFQADENPRNLNMRRIQMGQSWTIRKLTDELKPLITDFYAQFIPVCTNNPDVLLDSPQFRNYAKRSILFQKIVFVSSDRYDLIAFFVNAYNVLAAHGLVQFGRPGNMLLGERKKLLCRTMYNIGGHLYSLQDIEHGILRGNKPPPGSSKKVLEPGKDPRAIHALKTPDFRFHFLIMSSAQTSHYNNLQDLKVYTHENIQSELQAATSRYLECTVDINVDKDEIILPKIFDLYSDEFGGDEKGIINWVCQNHPRKDEISVLIHSLNKPSVAFRNTDKHLF